MTQPQIDPRIEQILSQIEVYQSVAADYGVPTWQAMPIASNPAIAFRPNCSQIEPVWQPTDTVWQWQGKRVHATPGQGSMSPQTALELQAAGVCVTGSHAVDIPLVSTDEVFTKFTQARSSAVALIPDSMPTAPVAPVEDIAPQAAPTGFNPVPLLVMVVVMIGLGIGGKFLLGKRPIATAQKSKVTTQQPPVENADSEDTVSLDYDFKL
jgi:hypothetical protein